MSDTPNPPSDPTPTPPGGPTPSEQPKAAATVTAATPNAGDTPDAADVEKNKVFALLSYISILWLVPLLAAKDSPYARFHANQGIILTIGAVVLVIVFGCGGFIFSFLIGMVTHGAGSCLGCLCYPLPFVILLVYAIMGILNAVNGKLKPLPGVPATLKIIK